MNVKKLWGRRASDAAEAAPAQTQEAEPPSSPGTSGDAERPREALALSLRSWGQFAIEIGEKEQVAAVRERFEHFADAVLGLGPEALAVDYDGLERFVSEHRRNEKRSVGRCVGDMQEALWAFLECFHRSLSSDRADDSRTTESLERLRAAIDTPDGALLRHEAIRTIRTLSRSIEARQERYEQQLELLSNKVARLSEELVRAQWEAATDSLTGLANRAAFDAHLAEMSKLGTLSSPRPVLMLMDVDHFKWVNDRFGHAIGDEVMRRTAARLRAELRTRHDMVARLGGDEFGAVMREVGPGAERIVSDRVLAAIRDMQVDVEGETVRCSMSVGTARLEVGESPTAWLRRADRALYEAKHAGRDRAVSADPKAEVEVGRFVPPHSELKGASPS